MNKDLFKTEITVKENKIGVMKVRNINYISLTDLARYANREEPKIPIHTWMRNKNVISYLGLWEKINNIDFKGIEFTTFENDAGKNSFYLSPQKWIKETNAIGIISKSGNNGGTYAHPDIAFEFASWLSPEFKLYLITEFERLKQKELEELPALCQCRKVARYVGRKVNGEFVISGNEIEIDGADDNIKYEPMCGKCYLKKVKKIKF